MIPRLQPRPSGRRTSGIENMFPVDATNSVNTNISPGMSDTSTAPLSMFTGESKLSCQSLSASNDESRFLKKNTQSMKFSQDYLPLSPPRSTVASHQSANSPVSKSDGNQYKHLLLNSSSSTSNSFETDSSGLSYSDVSLTPPTAGSRPPLIVSAKRYGSEVRRQHNKRRRRRRRPSSSRSVSQKPCSIAGNCVDAMGSDSFKEDDSDALCLWKADSYDEIQDNYLPLLASSDEEDEQTDRVEELVRAEHLKAAMVAARGNEKLPLQKRSFSANRAPPPKGCLSNPRPKRPRGHTTRYKTPPKSDAIDPFSESDVQPSRRVQFGIPSAVEYEIDRPPGHLTPISQEVTRKRYSMEPKEPTLEEDEITHETKQNNMILSEWEEQLSKISGNRSRSSDRSRRSGSSSKRNRKNRRSSSIFSPASRVSLIDNNNGQIVRKQKDTAYTSNSSDSKLNRIASKSASLGMSRSKTSLEETSSLTSLPTVSHADENRTWNFMADLGSINSKGAMELSPHTSSPGAKDCGSGSNPFTCNSLMTEKNSPPAADVNLESINTYGAAVDHSPNNRRGFRNLCRDSSPPCCKGASSDIISKMLIGSPWSDQEWDLLSLLRNLSSFGEDEIVIEKCLALLDPCMHNAISYTNGFVKRAMFKLSLKSTIPGNSSKRNSLFSAQSAIMTEWKEIELSLIENLTNLLHQFRSGIEKRSDFKTTIRNILLAGECLLPGNEKIEAEISKLENDIYRHKSSLDVLEASIAPFACVLCQATAQIGIHGFHFHEFRDDHILELIYMHAIHGFKTRVVVDIISQPGLLIEYDDGASNGEQNALHDLYRGYINLVKCGDTSFETNCSELQDSLLRLAQMFGKFDRFALALKPIIDGEKATITVDLPSIRLTFPSKDTIMSLMLDLECFETKIVSVSKLDGSDFHDKKTETLPTVDCCNIKSLNRVIYQYVEIGDVNVRH